MICCYALLSALDLYHVRFMIFRVCAVPSTVCAGTFLISCDLLKERKKEKKT